MCKNKYRTSGSFSQGAWMFVCKMKLCFDVRRLGPDKSHGGGGIFSSLLAQETLLTRSTDHGEEAS